MTASQRSQINSSGEVFLGGTNIEIGMSAKGSFGTSGAAPEGFFGTTGNSGIGLSNDHDGFGTGVDSRIDYFLPGSPEERWSIGFEGNKYGGFTQLNSDDTNGISLTNIQTEDLSTPGLLQAGFSGTVSHGDKSLDVSKIHSFEPDQQFFKTDVVLENTSSSTINDIVFMRSFDPDNTVYKGGDYTTINTVQKTIDSDGVSLVNAISKPGDSYNNLTGQQANIFYYSDEENSSVYNSGFSNSNPYAYLSGAFTEKGYTTTSDSAIGITFDVGTLDSGETSEFTYYTALTTVEESEDVIGEIEAGTSDLSVTEGSVSEILDLDNKITSTAESYSVTLDGDIEFVSSETLTDVQAQAYLDKLDSSSSFNSTTNEYSLNMETGFDELNVDDKITAQQRYTVASEGLDDVSGIISIKINGAEDQSTITPESDLSGTVNPGSLTVSGDVDLIDIDRTPATFISQSETLSQGDFTMNEMGEWSFSADPDYLTFLAGGSDPIENLPVEFRTTDGTSDIIDIELVGNRAPEAANDFLTLEAGSLKLAEVLANDSDPDGDSLTITSFSDDGDPEQISSLVGNDILIDVGSFADMLPGSDDLTELVDYTISDGDLTDAAQITVTITAPDADGTLISTSLADFDSSSFDLHSSIIGINDAAIDVNGSATVQTPVVLNSDSSASVVAGDAKAVANTTSIEGITDSSFAIASDLEMAASVQSSLDSSATSTDGIAVSNSLIGSQQGIELTDIASIDAIDAGGIANIAVGSSMSAASSADTVGDGSGNSGSLGVDGSWANTIADAHLGLGSGDLGGILGIDVASDAGISSSLGSVLSAEATADAGVAVSNAALNASTGMEDLNVEVGGLGLVSSINQSELASTASSTTDGASAIGLNELASGILNSDFNFSDVDSVMSAQTISGLEVEASTTTGNAWSSLDSASVGFEGATSSITGAAEITAIATDQGFAESSTVSGQATALADQSAIGMDGYSISNSSDLQLSALAEVDSSADSSATMS